jgi:hypothetical protein
LFWIYKAADAERPAFEERIANAPSKLSRQPFSALQRRPILAAPAQTSGQASGLRSASSDSSSFDLFEVAAPAVHRNHALEERAVPRLFTRITFEKLALATVLLERVARILGLVHIGRIQTKAHRFRVGIGLLYGFSFGPCVCLVRSSEGGRADKSVQHEYTSVVAEHIEFHFKLHGYQKVEGIR